MKVNSISHTGIRPLNEDSVLVNKAQSVFGVFDGASSLDKYLSADGKTGAYIAVHIASDTFKQVDGPLEEVALKTSENIEKAHREANIDVSNTISRFGTTAAVVRIRDNTAELLQIGDSVILIIYNSGQAEVPLGYHDQDLAIMLHWRKLADSGVTDLRGIVAEDVLQLRGSANKAYGMLNGDNKVVDFIKTMSIDLANVAAILLLTDGMFIPKQNPEADEDWNHYSQLYKQGGLDKIYETVREIEKSDPDSIKFPRYKMHDDASGIAIDL